MSSFGSSVTTSNTGSQTGTNTPTEAGNVTDFRNSLYPQISALIAQAGKPLYGNAEQAQFTNNLNRSTNANLNTLASQLAARTGSVNSGAFAGGVQNLLNQRGQAQAGYAMQVPMLNQQARMQNLGGALGLATNFAGRAPVGNVSSGTSQSTQTQTTNPSVFSDIMNVASGAMGIAGGVMGLPGLGGAMGAGTKGYMGALQSPINANTGMDYIPTPGFTRDAAGYVQGMGGY